MPALQKSHFRFDHINRLCIAVNDNQFSYQILSTVPYLIKIYYAVLSANLQSYSYRTTVHNQFQCIFDRTSSIHQISD